MSSKPGVPRLYSYDSIRNPNDITELVRILTNNGKSLITYFERLNASFDDSVESIINTITISNANPIGTINRITVTNGVIDIAINYPGQASINTLGNITTGTWNAGNITAPIIKANSLFLIPQLTEVQILAIVSPIEGTLVYNLNSHKLNIRTVSTWEEITSVAIVISTPSDQDKILNISSFRDDINGVFNYTLTQDQVLTRMDLRS